MVVCPLPIRRRGAKREVSSAVTSDGSPTRLRPLPAAANRALAPVPFPLASVHSRYGSTHDPRTKEAKLFSFQHILDGGLGMKSRARGAPSGNPYNASGRGNRTFSKEIIKRANVADRNNELDPAHGRSYSNFGRGLEFCWRLRCFPNAPTRNARPLSASSAKGISSGFGVSTRRESRRRIATLWNMLGYAQNAVKAIPSNIATISRSWFRWRRRSR